LMHVAEMWSYDNTTGETELAGLYP